jgi:DNA-binding MarR family transcriptional regulator
VEREPDLRELAGDLRIVLGQLVRRFRAEGTLPMPQVSALGWLRRQGPKTTSQLAALERVRPQSMAHTVAGLVDAGLVTRRPDDRDRRQSLIELSDRGRAVMEEHLRSGEGWIADAIGRELSADDRALLAEAIVLLRRLVDS